VPDEYKRKVQGQVTAAEYAATCLLFKRKTFWIDEKSIQ